MMLERQQQVEELYFAALEQERELQALFLADACAGDEELRCEVETLLAQQSDAERLLETPVMGVAAKLFALQQPASLVGQTLGAYKVLARLGAGGMGEVYQAQDTRLDRLVALKILPLEVANDKERLQRFVREAKAASALNHPHVATIYEIGAAESIHFIAMEYVAGQTLAAKINGHPLAIRDILDIGGQIADALDEAHCQGIIHRDIKPANVMLTARGQVKVLDFGLAKFTHPSTQSDDSNVSTLKQTNPGVVMGTVPYMSPEQALGHTVDHRSDIFSLGSVLYEMATGRLPFAGGNTVETLDRLLHAQPEEMVAFNEEVPVALERIVRQCLEKDREQRYQSAHDLQLELEALKHPATTSDHEVTRRIPTTTKLPLPRLPQRHWKLATMLLLAVIVLGGVGIWQLWFRAARGTSSIAVLPLKNLSNNPELEWFSDGITESLITEFQKIKALKVIASTSVMLLKDTKKPMAELARDLGVEAVLEGSALRIGDNVRITSRLIEPATSRVLWAQDFDREYKDVLSLYREVARTVANEVQIKLSPEEQANFAQARTVIPAAQDALLKGRYQLNHLWQDSANIQKAMESFEEAARLDPRNAEALAGIAESYALLGNFGLRPQAAVFPKARDAALQALEMDKDSAAAHRALIFWHFTWQHDWPLAEHEIKRALEIAPNDTRALSYYAEWLLVMGRNDEAIAVAKRYQELAPLDLNLYIQLGRIYFFARRYDEATRVFKTILDLDQKRFEAAGFLSSVCLAQKRYDEAWEWRSKFLSSPSISEEDRQRFTMAWHRGGWPAVWREELAWYDRRGLSLANKSGFKAVTYAQLGEADQAFAELEVTYQEHGAWLFQLSHPAWDGIRHDARFKNLLQRLNLPPR